MVFVGGDCDVVVVCGVAAVDFAVVAGAEEDCIAGFDGGVGVSESACGVAGLDEILLEDLLDGFPGTLCGAVIGGGAILGVDVESRRLENTCCGEDKDDSCV